MSLAAALRIALIALASGLVLTLSSAAGAQVLIDETTARFDWQAASGNVEFYEVWVSRSTRAGHYELEQTVTSASVTVQAEMGEVVRVRVRGGNETGFGPMSLASDSVRFGLPAELPGLGTPGVVRSRTSGSDTGDVFYADAETGAVWRFSTVDPDAGSQQIGSENDGLWQLAASGDFDGDGASDLFWQHATGATRIWYLDPIGYEEEPGAPAPGLAWSIETTGDFDGNGQDDLFWRDASGATLAWLRNAVEWAPVYFPPMPTQLWEMVAVGDFDADGFDDLLWRNVDTTDTSIWFTTNDPYNGLYAQVRPSRKRSLLWEVYETRDADDDGSDDIHWRLIESHNYGEWWYMDGEEVRLD